MSRDQLLETHDSRQLSEWLAFDNLYGLGDGYDVIGMICSVLSSVFSKGGGKPPEHFVPFFKAHRPRYQTPDQMQAVMSGVATSQNAKQGV